MSKKIKEKYEFLNSMSEKELMEIFEYGKETLETKRQIIDFLKEQNSIIKIIHQEIEEYILEAAVKKIKDKKMLADLAENKNVNYHVRIYATKCIKNQRLLGKIAITDSSSRVREAAIEKLKDEKILKRVAINETVFINAIIAFEKVTTSNYIYQIALKAKCNDIAILALKKIENEELLEKIISKNEYKNYEVKKKRIIAANNLKNQELLMKLILNEYESSGVRFAAIEKLENQDYLVKIALGNVDISLREEAINKIKDEKVLEAIATREDEEECIVLCAVVRLLILKGVEGIIEKSPMLEGDINYFAVIDEISDEKILIKIFNYFKVSDNELCLKILQKIGDYNVLEEILLDIECGYTEKYIRYILSKIDDENVVRDILEKSEYWYTKALCNDILNK